MDQNQHMCKSHPDTPAVAQCCVCGNWFCADCIATVGDKVYCKSHVQDAFSRDTAKGEEPPEISPYSRTVALLLCFFCGLIGLHLFYTGYVGRGILYIVLLIASPLLIGAPFVALLVLVVRDFIMIAAGTAKDSQNRIISK